MRVASAAALYSIYPTLYFRDALNSFEFGKLKPFIILHRNFARQRLKTTFKFQLIVCEFKRLLINNARRNFDAFVWWYWKTGHLFCFYPTLFVWLSQKKQKKTKPLIITTEYLLWLMIHIWCLLWSLTVIWQWKSINQIFCMHHFFKWVWKETTACIRFYNKVVMLLFCCAIVFLHITVYWFNVLGSKSMKIAWINDRKYYSV